MLFRVEASKDTFELNPSLKAIPEFERLTERQMTYVILVTDYKSPLRKLTPEERKEQAALIAGYKMDKEGKRLDTNARNLVQGKIKSVEEAVDRYKLLQKDEDYETLLALNTLIAQIRELNSKPDKNFQELAAAVNINVQKLDKLMETKKRIEELLDMREDEPSAVIENVKQEEIEEENLPILSKLNAGML